MDLRQLALEYAVRSTLQPISTDELIKHAEKLYEFLRGPNADKVAEAYGTPPFIRKTVELPR